MIGLAFCLIIIRFGMGGAFNKDQQTSVTPFPSSKGSSFQRPDVIIARPVAVRVNNLGFDDTPDPLNTSPTDFKEVEIMDV